MTRIKGDKVLEPHEMHDLARQLRLCGFVRAAVGINYIDFYDHVEMRRMDHVSGTNAAAAGGTEGDKV